MQISICNNYHIVEIAKEQKQDKSGLILPELEDESIVAIGKVVESKEFAAGTILLFNKLSPFDFELGGKKLTAVPDVALIATLTDLQTE